MTEAQVLQTLDEFKKVIVDLKAEKASLQEKALSLENAYTTLTEEAQRLNDELTEVKAKAETSHQLYIEQLEDKDRLYNDKCMEMEEAVSRLTLQRAEIVSAEIVQLKHNALETIKAYNERLDKKDAEIADKNAIINRLKSEIKKSKEAIKADEKESLAKTLMDKPQVEEIKTRKDDAIHFRFATSTQKIADDFVKFIGRCIDNEGPFVMSPEVAAIQLGLPPRERDSFVKHLLELQLKEKPLITKAKSGMYLANFNKDTIAKFVTEII